jgi:ribosomal protein L31
LIDRSNATNRGGCFIAQTPVHTRSGLVPISKVSLGDWVLSKPENSIGEHCYKRVSKLAKFEDKAVCMVSLFGKADEADDEVDTRIDRIVCTSKHPFWVASKNWMPAEKLEQMDTLKLKTGGNANVIWSSPLFKTQKGDDVAWGYALHGVRANDWSGDLVVFEDSGFNILPSHFESPEYVDLPSTVEEHGSFTFRRTVFNLEVEDFHTFYVGELGVLVHDGSCPT